MYHDINHVILKDPNILQVWPPDQLKAANNLVFYRTRALEMLH